MPVQQMQSPSSFRNVFMGSRPTNFEILDRLRNSPDVLQPGVQYLMDDEREWTIPETPPRTQHAPHALKSYIQGHRSSEYEEWKQIEARLKRARLGRIGEVQLHADQCATVPQNFQEYQEHKREFAKIMEEEEEFRLRTSAAEERVERQFGQVSFDFSNMPCAYDGTSTALGFPTIWTPVHLKLNPNRPVADWPSAEEFSEEGDERHTSQFGRFLPIPREPGNTTVNWKQKPFLIAEEFDAVSPVPLSRLTYPGLCYDARGLPYDDDTQGGRTAFVEKNPFDTRARLAYELQKANKAYQDLLLYGQFQGGAHRSMSPPHHLADLVLARARPMYHFTRDGPRRLTDPADGADGGDTPAGQDDLDLGERMDTFSGTDTSTGGTECRFNYNPAVSNFVPEDSFGLHH